MTTIDVLVERLQINRRLTWRFFDHLALVAAAEARERGSEQQAEIDRLLAEDPTGGETGSVGWNLTHVAVHEEACCSPLPPRLWDRFRHGVPPGQLVTSLAEVTARLAATRAALLERVERWRGEDLDAPPPGVTPPGMTRRQLLDAAVWHEPHHLSVCYGLLHSHPA